MYLTIDDWRSCVCNHTRNWSADWGSATLSLPHVWPTACNAYVIVQVHDSQNHDFHVIMVRALPVAPAFSSQIVLLLHSYSCAFLAPSLTTRSPWLPARTHAKFQCRSICDSCLHDRVIALSGRASRWCKWVNARLFIPILPVVR